jgi:hypothetical protein
MREVNAHGAALLTLEGAMRADAAADCRTDLSVLQPEPEPQTPTPSPKPQTPSPSPKP